ncbi:MAG: recombinase family protein [Lachnospiraceae bacterium]|nr:recombinase family protein [Lachnospiraceae bacterium]
MIYGYARISRKTQDINRQIRSINEAYPNAIIFQEAFTGRVRSTSRPEWNKLYKNVRSGDTLVFDSVSRMSRNAEDGIRVYFELFDRGVNLIFLNERHIDTDAYKKALENSGIKVAFSDENETAENTLIRDIIEALNKFMRAKASDDIIKAFEQSEKEVEDNSKRTKGGIETARINGKQIGQKPGAKLTTKKSVEAKKQIEKYSKDFNGTLSDADVMKLTGLSRNTYYKYKRELKEA